MKRLIAFLLMVCVSAVPSMAQTGQSFSDQLGPVQVKPVKSGPQVESPFMTWAADVGLFQANGVSLTTQPGSIYSKLGINLKFYRENDFNNQVKDYMTGRTPFLRCTYSMLGPASEVLNRDPRTKPVVFLFVSWSNGDHLIARKEIKSLNDLKPHNGKKARIALQKGGAHVGWLYELLQTAQINISDVDIVWANEMVGPGSPPDLFRKDNSIDAAFAITPDMLGLTSGIDAVGTGAEGTIAGAHVVVSTMQMARAIPDIVAVRSDWYKDNADFVKKYAAGYVKAAEEIVAMRNDFEKTKKMSPQYRKLLQLTQDAFGKDTIPTLEVDGHGLMLDCVFGTLPGNISFFDDKGNQAGFEGQMKSSLDMAQAFGFIHNRMGYDEGGLNWKEISTLAGVNYVVPDMSKARIVAEATNLFPDSNLDDRTIASFTIGFEPTQKDFSIDQYGAEFNRALRAANQFPNCVIVVRGHSDPTKTLVDFLKAGIEKNIIKRNGQQGSYQYFMDGKPLDLTQTKTISDLIKSGKFDGATANPTETMGAALALSFARANSVKDAISLLSKQQNLTVDLSQIQPIGAGINEPVIAKPKNMDEAKQNMRVEFRIVRVPAEAIKQSDFDF